MTIKEAKNILKDIRAEMEDARDKIAVDALNVAIQYMEDRPHGEWILTYPYEDKHIVHRECQKCCDAMYIDDRDYVVMSNFCPRCGADMRGGEHGEDSKP